jgi:hypothetical protein
VARCAQSAFGAAKKGVESIVDEAPLKSAAISEGYAATRVPARR